MKWLWILTISCFFTGLAANELSKQDVSSMQGILKRDKGFAVILGNFNNGQMVIENLNFYSHILLAEKSNESLGQHSHKGAVVELTSNDTLPYADHLINLLVVSNQISKEMATDTLRVMAPGGMLVFMSGHKTMEAAVASEGHQLSAFGQWKYVIKKRPAGFDEWSHIKGNANQSYVNGDTEVGPWEEIRWIGDPKWGSLYSSYSGLVTGGGKLYYKESRLENKRSVWYLVARDAYNGVELWRENIGGFMKYMRNPDYTLCADDDHVYLREGLEMVCRDGFTGKILRKYELKIPAEFAISFGENLVMSHKSAAYVFDKKTATLKWETKVRCSPAVENNTLFALVDNNFVGFDLDSGKKKWETNVAELDLKKELELFVKDGYLYLIAKKKWDPNKEIFCLNAKTGERLWLNSGTWGGYGVLPYKDQLWLLSYSNKKERRENSVEVNILSNKTGSEEKRFFIPGNVMGKCWSAKGSENYFLYSNGWYFDRNDEKGVSNNTTRSPCRLGQHPANGITYFMPHHCDCQVSLRGFLALAKKGKKEWVVEDENRLKKGAALGSNRLAKEGDADWPMYRKDSLRNNSTLQNISKEISVAWQKKVAKGCLTQAVSVGNLVFIGCMDANKVIALNSNDGAVVWEYETTGSVLSSPTISEGYCLFGTGSGMVTCLNAKDGTLLWQFRAAPTTKFIGDRDKLESAWPIQSSILVEDGVAYFSVGRADVQSLGSFLFAIKVNDGSVVWQKKADGSSRCPDMFFSNGTHLFHWGFGVDKKTGNIDKKENPSFPTLRTNIYLTRISFIDYTNSIEPMQTDKRHAFLSDGRQEGDVFSSTPQLSVVAGRYSTAYKGWKEKHGQFFLKAKGDVEWINDGMDLQIYGMVTTKDRIISAGYVQGQTVKNPYALRVYSLTDGKLIQELALSVSPVYDAISVANNQIYLASNEGEIISYR